MEHRVHDKHHHSGVKHKHGNKHNDPKPEHTPDNTFIKNDEEITKLTEKVNNLEALVSKLKSEKFKLASDNLKQAEKLEAICNQQKTKGTVSTDTELHLQEVLESTRKLVEERENQIVKLIDFNHILSSQIRFLSCHVFEKFDISLCKSNTNEYSDRASQDKTSNEMIVKDDDMYVNILKSSVETLEASVEGTRAELRVALKEYASAELRISEQQSTIESLNIQVEGIRRDLDNASGNAGTLRDQMKQLEKEYMENKNLLIAANRKLNEKSKELQSLENENRKLKESLSASEAARCDLTKICATHIRNAKQEALESFREFSERILFEREEMLTNLSVVTDLERDVRNAISKDTLRELYRLREELFVIRGREVQKDQEIEFLQKQLIEAADRISQYEKNIS